MNAQISKIYIIIIIVFSISLVGLKLYQYYWPKDVININGHKLDVLVAKSSFHHYKGLGGRKKLMEYEGMLFLFNNQNNTTIVMRNMLFPIDIIWLNDNIVVDMAPAVQPEPRVAEENLVKYYTQKSANMVLELLSGGIEKYDIKIGDSISLE